MDKLARFAQIWDVDFEYSIDRNLHPDPLCMVARERRTGQEFRLWREELRALSRAPFDTGSSSVLVAYSAHAECDSFLSLGWELPTNVIDLYPEYLALNNPTPFKLRKFAAALARYGLEHLTGALEKAEMQQKALTQTVWNAEDRNGMLNYCETDIIPLPDLYAAMEPQFNIDLVLMRGRFIKSISAMARVGIPVDGELHSAMVEHDDDIKRYFIERDGRQFDVFDDTSFSHARFGTCLARRGIVDWPMTASGRYATDHKTRREQARKHPEIAPLMELMANVTDVKFQDMQVGADNHARCWLNPFWTATGRNAPSPSRFIFAMPGWLRALIRPPRGFGLAYLDFKSQEVAVMAALCGDPAMLEDVRSGDPYLAFGKRAKLIPADATKRSHKMFRDQILKPCVLGPLYGMTEYGLAAKLGISLFRARELLARQRALYGTFYRWMQDALTTAQFNGQVSTPFGWTLKVDSKTSPRTVMNFFAQANAAEMMRCAAIAATEAGISVAAPVHDAFLIMAPLEELDDAIAHMCELMGKAARVVTNGLPIEIEVDTVVRYPDRFPPREKEGRSTWTDVMGILERLGTKVA